MHINAYRCSSSCGSVKTEPCTDGALTKTNTNFIPVDRNKKAIYLSYHNKQDKVDKQGKVHLRLFKTLQPPCRPLKILVLEFSF